MEFSENVYIRILQALQEMPFNVGKNLLIDFLRGDYKNKSISKNRLDELETFGTLSWERESLLEAIDTLSKEGMIDAITSDYNRFVKVLRLTPKGKNEIRKPTLIDKQTRKRPMRYSPVTEEDKNLFEELGPYLEGFNDEQKKAIVSNASHILCVAGAGTGKTTTLTKRIEFLVKFGGVAPKDILAITFTRKAREEMEKRLFELGITSVNVHTFNSFCEQILKRYEREIYTVPMRVQGYADKVLAMNLALSSLGLTMNEMIDRYFSPQQKKFKSGSQLANSFMNDCFSLLEYCKTSSTKLYDFSKEVEESEKKNAYDMYQIVLFLEEHMKIQGLRDYADQILDTITFFKEKSLLIPAFRHVLVDEYQDVNALQIELLHLIEPNNLFCVGDPRQSIFGWRGSDISYILEFEEVYPSAEIIHLTKNYRSNKDIVTFMNQAVHEMGLPNLQWHKNNAANISLIDFENETAEMLFVVNKILESGISFDETFVLARTNRQLQELSILFAQRNVPFIIKTDEQKNPVDHKEGSVTLATVHAIKGLEANHVFVIGCNEQNFPSKASDHPIVELVKFNNYDRLEEERRLFYVAISRAKEKLFLTYAGKKPTYFLTDEMLRVIQNTDKEQEQIAL